MLNIAEHIRTISKHSGKKDKERLITEAIGDKIFKNVLEWAYNPFKTFGVKKVSLPIGFGTLTIRDKWPEVVALLEGLMLREYTGNEASNRINWAMEDLSAEDQILLANIIKKDLRAGFSDSTINKACKGLIPVMPYMRCSLPKDAKFAKFTWEEGCYSQEKADGMFANINVINGTVDILGRSGLSFPMEAFEELEAAALFSLQNNTQTHGELLVYKDGSLLPREKSNGILNSILKGGCFEEGEYPVFVAWDQIPLDHAVAKGKYKVPYKLRFAALLDQLKSPYSVISCVPTKIVHSLKEAYAHAVELMKEGKEGTIVKNGDAPWKDGTSNEQIKLKLEFDVELRLKGFNAGNGKFADMFGSMIFESEDGILEVGVSGISDDLRAEIDANRANWMNSVCTIRANDIMYADDGGKHSLFLPRFVEIRYDKTEADTFSKIEAQLEAAKDADLCES